MITFYETSKLKPGDVVWMLHDEAHPNDIDKFFFVFWYVNIHIIKSKELIDDMFYEVETRDGRIFSIWKVPTHSQKEVFLDEVEALNYAIELNKENYTRKMNAYNEGIVEHQKSIDALTEKKDQLEAIDWLGKD